MLLLWIYAFPCVEDHCADSSSGHDASKHV